MLPTASRLRRRRAVMAASKVGDGRSDSCTACAVGAVSDAVTKVDLAAETSRIRLAAAELRILANHVIHACLL